MKRIRTNPLTLAEIATLRIDHAWILLANDCGDSYAKMAADLNRPIGTVRSRLNRARKALTKLREKAALSRLQEGVAA